MSLPKKIIIRESIVELKQILKKSRTNLAANRVRVLLELKKNEKTGISKRAVSEIIGISANSVQKWRTLYHEHGLKALLLHHSNNKRPSVFTTEEHLKMEKKLRNPDNALRGYVELHRWIKEELDKTVKYNTLFKYVTRCFGTKIKVARKSHVKKDVQAVEDFKKTLHISAGKPLRIKREDLKR